MVKFMHNRTKLQFATFALLSLLIQVAGCTYFSSTDRVAKRDVVPEFACCVSENRTKVFVLAERVLHQFEFREKEGSIAKKTANLKTPWQGRALSIGTVFGSDLLTAIVFDVNARHTNSSSKHVDDLQKNSMYSFRVQNGEFMHVKVVDSGFIDSRLLDLSKLMFTSSSQRDFDSDCDVSQSAIFADWTLNAEGNQIEVSRLNESETIYCSSKSRIRFSSSLGLPFLTNDFGIVSGKWEGERKFSFVPVSLESPPKLGGHENVHGKYDFEYSVDVSADQRFIGTAISFPQHIRFSVWDNNDGKLVLDTLYPSNGVSGPSDALRCFALGKTRFCVGQGQWIRIVDLEKNSVHQIDVHQLAKEYRSATLLSAEVEAEIVELCVVLTPFDTSSVRRIRIPLD